jgi:hypothetical protein
VFIWTFLLKYVAVPTNKSGYIQDARLTDCPACSNSDRHIRLFFSGEGPRGRRYGRTAALRLIVRPCEDDDDYYFLFFSSNGAPVEWNWQGKTELLGEKPVPVPLCPPQIPHGLTQDRTRASAIGGRRLTAWAMARPDTSALRQNQTFSHLVFPLTILYQILKHEDQRPADFIYPIQRR